MKTLHTTQIHNDIVLTEVEQHVNILRFNIDGYQESIEINYGIDFFKDGIKLALFRQPKPWVISNINTIFIRDAEFNKVPNPDYDAELGNEEFLKMPAFDYVMQLMMVYKVDLATIMTSYILEEAQDGFFD